MRASGTVALGAVESVVVPALPPLLRATSVVRNTTRSDLGRLAPNIMRAVWKENLGLLLDRYVFHEDYFAFVHCFAAALAGRGGAGDEIDRTTVGLGVKFVARFVIETLVRSKARGRVPEWMDLIKSALVQSPEGCTWLLEVSGPRFARVAMCLIACSQQFGARAGWMKRIFFSCPNSDTRRAARELLDFTLRQTLDRERPLYVPPRAAVPRVVVRGMVYAERSGRWTQVQ